MIFPETKIILDLCGGTGSWSKPYLEAGYDVRLVTLPSQDIRFYKPPQNVYGILAAPPCTMFCVMKNCRVFEIKEDDMIWAFSVVDACFRIITICNPTFWALENPAGTLIEYLGEPRLKFHPNEYGDAYTKYTYVWGNFHIPQRRLVEATQRDYIRRASNAKQRSITPQGFAYAFFEANR